MAVEKLQSASVNQFNGLRTDTPASKCPQGWSPDCADGVFSPGGFATRPPFRAKLVMPTTIVYEKDFQGRDGSTYKLVVTVDGAVYSVASDGTYAQIDSVQPGCSVTGAVAYGRLYLAFFNANGGCDAPRQWDGQKMRRVANGAPGAAPVVTNLTVAATAVSSLVRTAGTVTATTATAHGLNLGNQFLLSNIAPETLSLTSIVIDNTQNPGVATVTTPTPHKLLPGNVVTLSDVGQEFITTITSYGVSNGLQRVHAPAHGLQ